MLEITSHSHSVARISFAERPPVENLPFSGITVLQCGQYRLSHVVLLILLQISSYRACFHEDHKNCHPETLMTIEFYVVFEGMLGEG